MADQFCVPYRYPDVCTLLEKVLVDIIAVCLPVQFHADIARASLDAGKHVFIEKPLTVTLEEAEKGLHFRCGYDILRLRRLDKDYPQQRIS